MGNELCGGMSHVSCEGLFMFMSWRNPDGSCCGVCVHVCVGDYVINLQVHRQPSNITALT